MTQETERNVCVRFFDRIIWAGTDDTLLQFDFLKPAPCVSHKTLVILRVIVSVTLCILALVALVATADEMGFVYLSVWTMVQTTVLFAFMAVVQLKNQRRLTKFTVEVADETEQASRMLESQDIEDLDTTAMINRKSKMRQVDTPWKYWRWLIVVYQACFV